MPPQPTEPRTIFAAPVRATSTGILVLITLIAFEAMAVSAALPTAARELHGLGGYGWAFTGFLVANIVGMVVSGQLSDRRGAAPPLVVGLAAFLAGLLLAGTAATMALLVAGRVVQGLGAGLMITAIYVVIGQAYGERLRPPLFAAISSAWVVPSLVGPLVSGALAEHASWRLVFLGLAPFIVLGGILVLPSLRALHRAEARRDGAQRGPSAADRLLRALTVAGGVALLEAAGQHPSVLLAAVAVVGLAAVWWGLRRLLPPGTAVARPGVAAPVALRGLLAGAFFGVESILPLSLTVQHGFTPTAAGLPLAASGISWAVGSWWQGRDRDERGHRRRVALVRAGFGFVALGTLGVAIAAVPAVPGWFAYPAWLISGLGAGLAMSSVGILLLRYTSDATRGADSAALQLADATASALTTGVAGVLVAAAARDVIGYTGAFVTLGVLMCAVAGLGAAVAGRARPAAAAAGDAAPAGQRGGPRPPGAELAATS
ncbi:Predicted arabinose efflux permease, MFS family [Jatrophihabitans endophyticus]|uniref:Predicted arabinose efflux permease, MFS family n=1 Tax=Jatrophihabitans endophyticus TaxID=1206085 RepID=A0A1M5DBU3_9ACTN|nr:Predicted arabinose efflux permease, MFS family [Jatrophihabitans endophyticus]